MQEDDAKQRGLLNLKTYRSSNNSGMRWAVANFVVSEREEDKLNEGRSQVL